MGWTLSPAPRIGQLRHRVTIQTPTLAVDAQGVRSETWSELATAWADIRPLSMGEAVAAGQTMGYVTHRMTMRRGAPVVAYGAENSKQVRPKHRVTFGARTFEIQAVTDPDGRGRWIEVLVREVT